MPDLTPFAPAFAAYRAAVQSRGAADYPARAAVYAEIAREVGMDDTGKMAGAIKAELDRIEREETGRTDTGDDWRTRE
jgi:hypothetical protein